MLKENCETEKGKFRLLEERISNITFNFNNVKNIYLDKITELTGLVLETSPAVPQPEGETLKKMSILDLMNYKCSLCEIYLENLKAALRFLN